MTSPLRSALTKALAAVAGATLLLPTALSTTAHAQQSSEPGGARSAVTWNGWRGVHFGDRTAAAHHRLGGHLYRGTNAPGGCGDILTLHTGTIDAKVGPRAHRVSDFSVKPAVSYPLGIHYSMHAGAIKRRLNEHGYSVRTHRFDADGGGYYLDKNISVGPHGHALYYVSDPEHHGKVVRMGLALDTKVARELLVINGC